MLLPDLKKYSISLLFLKTNNTHNERITSPIMVGYLTKFTLLTQTCSTEGRIQNLF